MKKISGLNEALKDYHGKELAVDDKGGLVTVGQMLERVIATSASESGRDAFRLNKACDKMVSSQGEVELEDYDFILLQKAIDKCGFSTLVKGRLFEASGGMTDA